MPENELIIRHKGEEYGFELTERDANLISDLTAVMKYAPQNPERVNRLASPFNTEEQEAYAKRFTEHQRLGADFNAQLKRIANLDEYQTSHLLAYLDLIELGDLDGSQSNWVLEFIDKLLMDVIRYGPAAALHQDPRGQLSILSHFMYNYWLWVKESREVIEQHPEIFPAPRAEPESTVATRQKPQPRKRRQMAA